MKTMEMSKIIMINTLTEKIKIQKTILDSLKKMINQENFKPLTEERKRFLDGANENAKNMQDIIS
jgi:hypothetical protein